MSVEKKVLSKEEAQKKLEFINRKIESHYITFYPEDYDEEGLKDNIGWNEDIDDLDDYLHKKEILETFLWNQQ